MKSFLKSILFLVVALALSYLTSSWVGNWYDGISFQDGGLIGARNYAVLFAGFVISYIFFIPFIFGLFGINQNKKWIMGLLLPAVLLMLVADKYHFYIPLLLILIALGLAVLLRKILRIAKPSPIHSN